MSEQEVFDALKYRIEVDKFGTWGYYNSAGELHRDDGPAVEWADGNEFWYINGWLMSEAEFKLAVKSYERASSV